MNKHCLTMRECLDIGRKKAALYDVTILDNEVLDVGAVRIIGSTLWSHVPEEHYHAVGSQINDYQNIVTERGELTVHDTNSLHKACVDFIGESVRDGQIPIVVTHHAPQIIGTADPMYIGTARNSAFATDVQHLYPGVHTWIFGHTHFACDFVDETTGTRVLSNPKGYPGERVMFKRGLIVEVV